MHARVRVRLGVIAAWLCLVALAACGGGSQSSPSPAPAPTPSPAPAPSPSGGPVATTTITITASGVSPSVITVPPGSRVTFINNDRTAHDMTSDPHPEHTDCPEINQVGFLTNGQSRQTGNLNTARTCGFHDHNLPSNRSLQGRIIIQ